MTAAAPPPGEHSFDDGQCDRCGCSDSYQWSYCPGPIEGQPRRCGLASCTNAVACFGAYEGSPEGYACNEHCGHGCEDGRCWPIVPKIRGPEDQS